MINERRNPQWQIDWPLVACVSGALLMLASVALATRAPVFDPYLSLTQSDTISKTMFVVALVAPVLSCWRRAVRDNQLPAKHGLEPIYEHVSGWGAIFLIVVIAVIAAVVSLAAQSDEANRKIHASWGVWVVIGLTVAFLGVAAAPITPRLVRALRLDKSAAAFAGVLSAPINLIGSALSVIDSILVFAVANAAGANRRSVFLRYGILLSSVGACAALGFLWPSPWAFVPITWAFIVAFAVSRRWAWIEQDRELAMLNSTISKAHIRVGFGQNLRDEALVAFLSMFLLVPLALRQAQIWSGDNHIDLFTLAPGADIDSLSTWISFYGTELAKAVPFVDWAEVYHVEGDGPVGVETALALHAVFLTRVLIDLVFLAALLQAVSSAARDSQQKDLFYRKQSIHLLDPFTEPVALRSLVRKKAGGGWEEHPDNFNDFPRNYDANRLVELSANPDERIARAADFLLRRDNVQNDPHHVLSMAANDRAVSPEAVVAHLNAIENAGPGRNPYQLALARRRLLPRRNMAEVRLRLVAMISQSPRSVERTEYLIEAMVGENREAYARARGVALDALSPDIGINLRIKNAIQQVADHDGAPSLKGRAADVLQRYPETPDDKTIAPAA